MADSPLEDTQELLARAQAFIGDDPEESTREAIAALIATRDLAGLAHCFQAPLAFGTAGLRGTLGPGPAHMNIYVVERTTAALCMHLSKTLPHAADRGICIGYDARHRSQEFAHAAARVALGQGMKVRLFTAAGPTPLLAFSVTRTNAAAGVMVTASHNPPAYNGYKVYNGRGAQITSPDDALISAHIERLSDVRGLPRPTVAQADHRLVWLDEALTADYRKRITLHRPAQEPMDLRIAYTPMHGVGGALCLQVLADAGFSDTHPVRAQFEPDPDSPTVAFPHPEEDGAMDMALALGEEVVADLVIANDPDADRLALGARDHSGTLAMLTGNDVGVLLCDYLLENDAGRSDERQALMCCSIVSTPMALKTAAAHGARPVQTLTGFKWICNEALRLEQQGYRFVFGFEEALGYAIGSDVRDKDGIAAAVVASQVAAKEKAQGRTLWDALARISRRDGCYVSGQHAAEFAGPQGSATIAAAVDRFRRSPPTSLAGHAVAVFSDLLKGTRRDLVAGEEQPTSLPSSNVLIVELASGDRVCVRPSGTEPKLKLYIDACVDMAEGESLGAARARAYDKLQTIQAESLLLLGLPSKAGA